MWPTGTQDNLCVLLKIDYIGSDLTVKHKSRYSPSWRKAPLTGETNAPLSELSTWIKPKWIQRKIADCLPNVGETNPQNVWSSHPTHTWTVSRMPGSGFVGPDLIQSFVFENLTYLILIQNVCNTFKWANLINRSDKQIRILWTSFDHFTLKKGTSVKKLQQSSKLSATVTILLLTSKNRW